MYLKSSYAFKLTHERRSQPSVWGKMFLFTHTFSHIHNKYPYILKFIPYYQVGFQNSKENTKFGEIKIYFYHHRNLRKRLDS